MIAMPRQQIAGGKLLDFSRYETSQREVSLARLRHAGLLRKSAAVERGEFPSSENPTAADLGCGFGAFRPPYPRR
jgi:hypothetical protein